MALDPSATMVDQVGLTSATGARGQGQGARPSEPETDEQKQARAELGARRYADQPICRLASELAWHIKLTCSLQLAS